MVPKAHSEPEKEQGGLFLWRYPSAHAAQALPGTLPCGARTFLRALRSGCPADSRRQCHVQFRQVQEQ